MMKTREKKPTLSRPSPPILPIAQPQQRVPVKISGDGGNLISDIGRQFSILFHGGDGDKKKMEVTGRGLLCSGGRPGGC